MTQYGERLKPVALEVRDEAAAKVLSIGYFTTLQILFAITLYSVAFVSFLSIFAEVATFLSTASLWSLIVDGFILYLLALLMPFATLLVLGSLAVGQSPGSLDNLTFASGRLTGWEGNGFAIGPAGGPGPTLHFGVDSADRGTKGHKALLYRTITVPPGVSALRVRVAARRFRSQASEHSRTLPRP